jgi:hypothetical protein
LGLLRRLRRHRLDKKNDRAKSGSQLLH